MKFSAVIQKWFVKPAIGAALAALCGLLLWASDLGEPWVNASYDYLFRFGARPVTNKVVTVLMDEEALGHFHQVRRSWSRDLHKTLLNRLSQDGCPVVVFDTHLKEPKDPAEDEALAEAMERHGQVVLMSKQADSEFRKAGQKLDSVRVIPPAERFLKAARTNGVAKLDWASDGIVRHHWPFPSPSSHPSLPWVAAQLAGASLDSTPQERWLRYYGKDGQWESLPYHIALTQPTGFFSGKIVFIGYKPETSLPDGEEDEFSTPYTRWTSESSGGVEIQVAAFLNLLNQEWLQRPAKGVERTVLIACGLLLGGLCRLRPLVAFGVAIGVALVVMLGAVSWSYFTNLWFPWLIVAGGQVPCGLVWALAASRIRAPAVQVPPPTKVVPDAPDYELISPPFGEGAYGKVWLVRNAIGQWQALKAVYLDKFGNNTEPFDRELRGIERYKPVSDKHPGLLRVDFISRRRPEGYFYYVMELGDAQTPGWEKTPATYKPRDLASVRAQANRNRLPVRECVRIGIALSETLDFLHRQDLTHRDIKPSNIVFVNGRPKLADVGLVADARPADHTWVGTPGYMPPPPEQPGTPQADIYGLGMVLYVISTGREPALFPELSTTLVEGSSADFIRLNAVIINACQPDCTQRYASAAELLEALRKVEEHLSTSVITGR